MRKKLVLLGISYNEEKHIKFWIDNHRKFVNDIILVDTGSTDDTIKIAKENGAKVFSYLWRHDFARAKNFALRCCSIACHPDWVLFLGLDWWISNSDMKCIRQAIKKNDFDAYRIKIMYHKGDYLNMEELTPINPETGRIFLFKDDPYTFYTGKVHETVDSSLIVTNKKVGLLEAWGHHGTDDQNTKQGMISIQKKEDYYQILNRMWNLDYALHLALNQIRELLWKK